MSKEVGAGGRFDIFLDSGIGYILYYQTLAKGGVMQPPKPHSAPACLCV